MSHYDKTSQISTLFRPWNTRSVYAQLTAKSPDELAQAGQYLMHNIPSSPPSSQRLKSKASSQPAQRNPYHVFRPNFLTAWVPNFLRRLRWRMRRCSLWEAFVFCSFVGASAVFIGALAGVGHVSNHPENRHLTARAPGSKLLRHIPLSSIEYSDIFAKFLHLGRTRTGKDTEEDDRWDDEYRAFFEPISRETWYKSGGHVRPRVGAWIKPRHRMSVVREPSIQLPSTDQTHHRLRHAVIKEPSQSRPNHGLFHERFSQLMSSTNFPDDDEEDLTDDEHDDDRDAQWEIINDKEKVEGIGFSLVF